MLGSIGRFKGGGEGDSCSPEKSWEDGSGASAEPNFHGPSAVLSMARAVSMDLFICIRLREGDGE